MKKFFSLFFYFLIIGGGFYAQNDSLLLADQKKMRWRKDSVHNAFKRGDTTFLVSFYSYTGPAIPIRSFSGSSTAFNNLGKSTTGWNFKFGAELFINSKYTVSFDYDRSIFLVRNDSLTAFIKKDYNVITKGASTNNITVSDNFHTTVTNYGFGLSRLVHFGKFSIQAKITPSVGRIRYNYLAIVTVSDTSSSPTTNSGIGPGNYFFKTTTFFALKPEINFKYLLYKQKYFALVLNCGVSYFKVRPVMALHRDVLSFSDKELIAFTDNVSSIGLYFGINFILRKTRI